MSLTLDACFRRAVGLHHTRSEDAAGIDRKRALLVVADGLGGCPAGDVASHLAVRSVLGDLASPPALWERDPGERMAQAVSRTHRALLDAERRPPGQPGMGTTLTILALDLEVGRAVVGHVGDSRAYLLRDGRLTLLTTDHTQVAAWVRAGRLSAEAARTHPWRNALTRSLGAGDVDPPACDVRLIDVRAGDRFLLCTDGLWEPLSDDAMAQVLAGAARARRAAEALVGRARRTGPRDDATAVVGFVSPAVPDPALTVFRRGA